MSGQTTKKVCAFPKKEMKMRAVSYSMLRAVCALVIGLVLVLFPNQAAEYLVITVGVIFLVPSVRCTFHCWASAVCCSDFGLSLCRAFLPTC